MSDSRARIRLSQAVVSCAALSSHLLFAQPFSSDRSPSTDTLRHYLSGKGSAIAASADTLFKEGQTWDIDPRLIVAIAGAESSFGRRVCAAHNAWNWFYKRTCPPSTFDSYDEGIRTVTKFMQRSYLRKGYDSVAKIQVKYCSERCDNWTRLVETFLAEIPASSPTPAPPPVRSAAPPPQTGTRGIGLETVGVLFALAAIVGTWLYRGTALAVSSRPPRTRR
jgi:hypothetical protein